MRIQHNIPAMNSYRNYTANTKAVSKNLEKLSSGYRINRAGDDAAGLAISEKMRAQITGLKTAQKNAKDGISLIQTAEGALTEVHSMLNRMVELADQSANGTFDNETDRANLQKEITQLKSEIDRIADSTNFNGIKLLDGSLGSKMESVMNDSSVVKGTEELSANLVKSTSAATTGTYEMKLDLDSAATDGSTNWLAGSAAGAQLEFVITDTNDVEHTLKFNFDGNAAVTTGDLMAAINTLMKDGIENGSMDAGFLSDNKAAIASMKEVFSSFKMVTEGADGIKITAESAATGSATVGLKEIKVQQRALDASGAPADSAANFGGNNALTTTATSANITQVAKDEYTVLTPTTADLSAEGSTFTVGDHTFELKKGDNYKVSDGNIRVVMGKDDAETLKNLVAAMKDKGIDSASATSDGKIRIDDVDQLKTADKTISYKNMVDIKSASLGVKIDTVEAINASETYDIAAGTAGDHTLGIGYVDKDGNAQTLKIDYTSTNSQGADGQAIADAINNSADAKGLFKATFDSTNNELKIESLGGKDGVTLKSVNTTDAAAGAVAIDTAQSQDAVSAGKSVTINNGALASGDTVSVGGKEYQFLTAADIADPSKIKKGATAVMIGTTDDDTAQNLQNALANDGVKGSLANNVLTIYDGESLDSKGGGGLTLQIGDTAEEFNKLTVSVDSMHAENLGIDDIDIGNQEGASAAIDKIKSAINQVSSTRGDLGAAQNRLDHTINNLSVMTENIQDAESAIRDVDVADEMMAYTKNNILVQSAQAMLAQANQLPQGVLQLLG